MSKSSRIRRRRAIRGALAIGLRVALALMVLAAGVVSALISQKVWKDPPERLLLYMLLIIGAATFYDSSRTAWLRARSPARTRAQTQMQKGLVAALAEIAATKGVPIQELGGSVFVVRPGLRILGPLRHRWSWSCEYLERILRFRLTDTPQPTDVDWIRSKGTIGRCWELEKSQYMNWLPIANRHGNPNITQAEFNKIKPETRQNLTFQEFRAIVDKYAEILTVPLKGEDGQVVGVVSIDLAKGDRTREMPLVLQGRDVEAYATTAAAVVQKARSGR